MLKRTMFCAVLCILISCSAFAQNSVAWNCSLTDLGGGQYSYSFHFANLGPEKDAVYSIHFDDVPTAWTTDSWALPTGWWGENPLGGKLKFQTNDGSIYQSPPEGLYRLWGQDYPVGTLPGPGWRAQTFVWNFATNGGPVPTAGFFPATDVSVYIRNIADNWGNDNPSYIVNPVPEPASLLALSLGLGSLGLAFRRRAK